MAVRICAEKGETGDYGNPYLRIDMQSKHVQERRNMICQIDDSMIMQKK
jgi:hypothetical protein